MDKTVFIVLFRGVGGATKLPSQPLREALTGAGFEGVRTYIATGNVVLASELDLGSVRQRVGRIALDALGFAKEIMVASVAEWADLIARNPFPEATRAPRRLHAFLANRPIDIQAVAALAGRAAPTERIAASGRALYFHAPEGFGRSKLPPVVDRLIGQPTTARNWNTVTRLAEFAQQTAGGG